MSLTGKILAILCVLTAVPVFYAITIDWGRRHPWAYAVFRDDLILNGLPLDEEERDRPDPADGVPLADKLSDSTLQQMFQSVGGRPVKTQKEEVERVRNEILAQIDAADVEEKVRRERLAGFLLPLARTLGDRQALHERILDAKVPFEDLRNDCQTIFDEVIRPESSRPAGADADRHLVAQLLPRNRRQAVAHLLFNLKPQPEAHARLQVVIGLKAFVEEAKLQADNLRRTTEQVRFAIRDDRTAFEVEHRNRVAEIRNLLETLESRNLFLKNQQQLKKQHEQLVADRQRDIDEVKKKLAAARTRTHELLQEQAQEEKVLFESQRIIGGMVSENERLERMIRKMETAGR